MEAPLQNAVQSSNVTQVPSAPSSVGQAAAAPAANNMQATDQTRAHTVTVLPGTDTVSKYSQAFFTKMNLQETYTKAEIQTLKLNQMIITHRPSSKGDGHIKYTPEQKAYQDVIASRNKANIDRLTTDHQLQSVNTEIQGLETDFNTLVNQLADKHLSEGTEPPVGENPILRQQVLDRMAVKRELNNPALAEKRAGATANPQDVKSIPVLDSAKTLIETRMNSSSVENSLGADITRYFLADNIRLKDHEGEDLMADVVYAYPEPSMDPKLSAQERLELEQKHDREKKADCRFTHFLGKVMDHQEISEKSQNRILSLYRELSKLGAAPEVSMQIFCEALTNPENVNRLLLNAISIDKQYLDALKNDKQLLFDGIKMNPGSSFHGEVCKALANDVKSFNEILQGDKQLSKEIDLKKLPQDLDKLTKLLSNETILKKLLSNDKIFEKILEHSAIREQILANPAMREAFLKNAAAGKYGPKLESKLKVNSNILATINNISRDDSQKLSVCLRGLLQSFINTPATSIKINAKTSGATNAEGKSIDMTPSYKLKSITITLEDKGKMSFNHESVLIEKPPAGKSFEQEKDEKMFAAYRTNSRFEVKMNNEVSFNSETNKWESDISVSVGTPLSPNAEGKMEPDPKNAKTITDLKVSLAKGGYDVQTHFVEPTRWT